VTDQISHPYGTTGKIIFLYVLVFTFQIADGKTKDSEFQDCKYFLNLVCSYPTLLPMFIYYRRKLLLNNQHTQLGTVDPSYAVFNRNPSTGVVLRTVQTNMVFNFVHRTNGKVSFSLTVTMHLTV
jgi:hypothetical protein